MIDYYSWNFGDGKHWVFELPYKFYQILIKKNKKIFANKLGGNITQNTIYILIDKNIKSDIDKLVKKEIKNAGDLF